MRSVITGKWAAKGAQRARPGQLVQGQQPAACAAAPCSHSELNVPSGGSAALDGESVAAEEDLAAVAPAVAGLLASVIVADRPPKIRESQPATPRERLAICHDSPPESCRGSRLPDTKRRRWWGFEL